MRTLYLSLGLMVLAFCAGCGSSSSSSGGTGPTPMGNFSAASLSGQYVYQVTGFDFSSGSGVAYARSGVFVANGAGVLTSVVDDFSEGTATTSTISGTYSVSNDGTGSIVFSFPTGSITYAITLLSSSKVYMAEANTTLSGGGVADKQDTTALAAPTGTYVFRRRTLSTGATPTSYVGSLSLTAGSISTGTNSQDSLVFGSTLTSLGLNSALFNTPDSLGRASGSITDANSVTTTFEYYVVDANNIRIFTTDAGLIGLGRAEKQSATTFSNSSLSGSFAFGAQGDSTNFIGGIRTVGSFTSDGAGNITAGAFDNVTDGNVTLNSAFTATYSMAASGRAVLTQNTGGQQIYWMVSPTRAFFLTNSSTQLSDGTADAQVGSNFTNASITGQFGFLMNGFTIQTGGTTSTLDRVATLQFDAKGGLILNEFVNANGSSSTPGFLTGTYSTSANGRITGTITGATNNIGLSMYLISNSSAYTIDNDTGFELDGQINLQQ